MPLMKQRGYKFSILCDVFLLLLLQVKTYETEIVLNLPNTSSLQSNNSFKPILSVFYANDNDDDDGREKSADKLDAYKDFSDDTIHRILRDEEAAYHDESPRTRKRWKRSISSIRNHIFYKIQKRSVADVNNVDLFFDNKYITESSKDSTKVIELVNRNLTDPDVFKFLLKNLIQSNLSEILLLNLTNNHLSEFKVQNLVNLTKLRHLDLSGNDLDNFTLNNSSIEIINLSGNHVSNFTSSSSENNNLLELILHNNNLSSAEYLNFTGLNRLQHLDLSCNQIAEVKKNSFRQVKNLRRLNLSKNRLERITKEPFYNLLNIDTLILSYNNISSIDLDTFVDLPSLQYLDLSHNNIRSDSVRALQGIPDLVGLSIAYNPDLGDSLQEFVSSWSLKELDASGTSLCKIPAALAQSVRALKLVENWFSVIRCGDLDSYPLLQYLDLSSCHINEIEEDALGRLEILETLFLDHNNLRRVPISLPTSLENLFLQNNQIMDIQPHTFQTLSNLKTLDLSRNKLIYLPELPLPKLLTLNLQSSELRGLSQSVVKTSPKLKDLLLDGNPIKCSDLLGIAEWASPCQNERIIQQQRDIKGHFQSMHSHFESFRSNHKSEIDCISAADITELRAKRRPECADSNIKFIQSNKLELQLQGLGQITATNTMSNANLLHFLTSFLEHSSEGIEMAKNFTEEEQNFVRGGKQEISLKHHDNQNGSFLEVYNNTRDQSSNPSSSENTTAVYENNENNLKRNLNGQIKENKDSHINVETTKPPILSFWNNSTENTTKFPDGSGTSENITQHQHEQQQQQHQQQHKAILSKIKSDNNYVETSVLLGQDESSVVDGINRGTSKLVVQVGSHDPTADRNFKSENIDSEPKVKEDTLSDEKHIRGELMGVNSLHKIDEGNVGKFQAINSSGIYAQVKNITEIDKNFDNPSIKGQQQLAENRTNKENLSQPLSPSQEGHDAAADEVIKNCVEQKEDEAINSTETKANLLKDNIKSRPTIKTATSTSIEMGTTTTVTSTALDTVVQFTTATEPLVALSQRMMASKVNKADKVLLLDQPSAAAGTAVDGNGIIKRKQNVSQPLGQYYQQIQKAISKSNHRHSQQQQQQQQQLSKSEERKMQRRPKLLHPTIAATVQNNRYNKESQQKPRNAALTQLSSEGIIDKNHEFHDEDTGVMKTFDRNSPKALVNGEKYSIKHQKKDMHTPENLSNQNQIHKGASFRDNFDSTKIEKILGKGSNRIVNPPVKLEDSTLLQGTEYSRSKFLKLAPLKKSLSEKQKKFLHPLNIAKDSTNAEPSEEDFSRLERMQGILQKDIAKSEHRHTINTENLPYTADYMMSRELPIPTKGIKVKSENFSSTNGEPNIHTAESHHLKVNKDFSSDQNRISNTETVPSGISQAAVHHNTQASNSSSSSSSGLPPEQWLDIRTTAGHPGLFIVIGVTFGMLFALGLIHIYRCRRPWGYIHGPGQFQNHNHHHHAHRSASADASDYCNNDDNYYIEMDQESQSSVQKDFLPMELLNSSSKSPRRQKISGW